MSEAQLSPIASGFGLRVIPRRGPFRFCRASDSNALELRCEQAGGATVLQIYPGSSTDGHATELAMIEPGPAWPQWWIAMPAYRVPLPANWTVVASGAADALPPFELLGPDEARIFIRTPRRMSSLTSLLAPGQNFRNTGQLERAAWIEFEAVQEGRAFTHRHELLHRGLMPFVFTLQVPDEQLAACLPALEELVAQVQPSDPPDAKG